MISNGIIIGKEKDGCFMMYCLLPEHTPPATANRIVRDLRERYPGRVFLTPFETGCRIRVLFPYGTSKIVLDVFENDLERITLRHRTVIRTDGPE